MVISGKIQWVSYYGAVAVIRINYIYIDKSSSLVTHHRRFGNIYPKIVPSLCPSPPNLPSLFSGTVLNLEKMLENMPANLPPLTATTQGTAPINISTSTVINYQPVFLNQPGKRVFRFPE